MPNVHGSKVRAVWRGIPGSWENSYLTLIPEILDGAHGWMECITPINVKSSIFRDAHCLSIFEIMGVIVRNNRTHEVIAARQLEYYIYRRAVVN